MPHRVRDTDTSARTILIRRNLDQTAVWIAAIGRAQCTACALFGHRAFLHSDAAGTQMRNHLLWRRRGEKAQIVAARGLEVRSEPLDLVGIARAHIDLLVTEYQRGARRLAAARIEHPDLHAEHLVVPL